ncbi:MAG: methionine biosynthesis protein MetW [Candidatus Aminicenantes bacterium]|nr:MAG: methionine biosynthesis protein MetW [Candidatus Aminicenantes bacterium]
MRFDLQIIASFIEENSRILDLGCGRGELLEFLQKEKSIEGYGIEIDEEKVIDAIARGMPVLRGDINEETQDYADNTFDYVILSQTLQQVYNPDKVIKEMLRIGKKGIVSFPCFNHIAIRLQLLITGKAPVTEELPYEWYNTPNIRVITLEDFRVFCAQHKIKILKELAISSHHRAATGKIVKSLPDLFAKYGIFLLSNQFLHS